MNYTPARPRPFALQVKQFAWEFDSFFVNDELKLVLSAGRTSWRDDTGYANVAGASLTVKEVKRLLLTPGRRDQSRRDKMQTPVLDRIVVKSMATASDR